MSVIMKREFDGSSNKSPPNSCEPIEYIDSLAESSFINAINTAVMKRVRELSFEANVYGTSDVRPILISSESELTSKDAGLWVLDTSIRDPENNIFKHSLTIYQRIKYPGKIWNSFENRKIVEYYNVKCKRTVPQFPKEKTNFQKFEEELETKVKSFKINAERSTDKRN